MRVCTYLALSLCLASTLRPTSADELLPPDRDITTVVDHYVDASLTKAGLSGNPQANDGTWLRRVTLDLAGRIPTSREYDWFRQQTPDASRKQATVDRLMSLPDFDFHLRNSLDELLLFNRPYDSGFREYLLWAVKQRRPWDQMFRDMMLARYSDGVEKGSSQFLLSRVRELDDLTNDTAILFFGVNISCAKCHDHPLVEDWHQDHFYGMQAFFSRTFATRKNVLSERPFGDVKYKTTEGEEKQASFMFLTGLVVEDKSPKFEEAERKQLEEQLRKMEQVEDAGYILYPTFSPRHSLVEVAIKDERERLLAKNIVNRTWNRLLGLGLVDPPDQMHSGNPPSHPELLEWLARDLATHAYDLRRLIRGIVLSNAYGRSSEWTSESEPPAASTFAVIQTKPMTPRQLSASMLVAVRNPEQWPADLQSPDWIRHRQDIENQADGWSREFEQPSEQFQIAVDEALFFSNGERIQNDLLRDSGDRIVGQLKAIEDHAAVTRQLWINVVNREPTPEEQTMATDWLARTNIERSESIRSLLWALLTGPEFRFNH